MRNFNLLPYSTMYRRSAWEGTGGYRTRLRTGEDVDFWQRISSYGFTPKMVTQADCLIYRNRPGSMSRVNKKPDWAAWFAWANGSLQRAPAGLKGNSTPPVIAPSPPVLSVVIPVGPGHGDLVQRAVDSLEAQSFRSWECIVVNDSGAPLGPLPAWVRHLATPAAGSGPAMARNIGAAAAQGAGFIFLDADDFLQPNALEVWTAAAARHPGTCIYADWWEDPEEEGQYRRYRSPNWEPTALVHGQIGAVTQYIPREAWERSGGFDESLPGWEDWGLQLRMAELGICSRRIPAAIWTYTKGAGRRREQNVKNFESCREAIMARWGAYWRPGAQLMACGCSNRGAQSVVEGFGGTVAAPGMAALAYTGERDARHSYKSPRTNMRYSVARGDWFYAMEADVPWLLGINGFQRFDPSTELEQPAPLLV
jgi:hypothetical protein